DGVLRAGPGPGAAAPDPGGRGHTAPPAAQGRQVAPPGPPRPIKAESRPVSRVLSRAIIPLGSASPRTSSGLPGSARGSALPRRPKAPRLLPYLALLRVGFAVPSRVTTDAVRSYRTVSPLPVREGLRRSGSLLHFPWARAPQALPG